MAFGNDFNKFIRWSTTQMHAHTQTHTLMDCDGLTKMRKDTSRWQMTKQKTMKRLRKEGTHGARGKGIWQWQWQKGDYDDFCVWDTQYTETKQTERKIMCIALFRMHLSIAHGSNWAHIFPSSFAQTFVCVCVFIPFIDWSKDDAVDVNRNEYMEAYWSNHNNKSHSTHKKTRSARIKFEIHINR